VRAIFSIQSGMPHKAPAMLPTMSPMIAPSMYLILFSRKMLEF
jgi:hypothetical protein